jgi:hypothetical protein
MINILKNVVTPFVNLTKQLGENGNAVIAALGMMLIEVGAPVAEQDERETKLRISNVNFNIRISK